MSFGSMDGFKVELECGKCGVRLKAPEKLLQFARCSCENGAQIALENREQVSHLLAAQDEERTLVHVHAGSTHLPPISLSRWKQLQTRFKSVGALTPADLK